MMEGIPSSDRPQISRDFIEGHRRRRYVEATAEILHEFGRAGLTATNVVRVAGGARGSFYQAFAGIEDCIAYGVRLAERELFAGLEVDMAGGNWLTEVREAIDAFFDAVVARPLVAELFLIHSAVARTDSGRAAFRTGGERFVPLLLRGRLEADVLGRCPPPDLIAECLSRAIVDLAARRVRGPEVATLPSESRAMTSMVGDFYLGREDSRELLCRQFAA
ncbi:MAG TPA: TetR/AcrR family transcriptional regulator [Solirubrobacterales bacterium]|jgi:AcrR family transcriptional regulator